MGLDQWWEVVFNLPFPRNPLVIHEEDTFTS